MTEVISARQGRAEWEREYVCVGVSLSTPMTTPDTHLYAAKGMAVGTPIPLFNGTPLQITHTHPPPPGHASVIPSNSPGQAI